MHAFPRLTNLVGRPWSELGQTLVLRGTESVRDSMLRTGFMLSPHIMLLTELLINQVCIAIN